MKVGGVENDLKVVFGPVTFCRGPGKYLAFLAQPVWSLEGFNALCPAPVNRNYVFTKQGKQLDVEAPAFKDEQAVYYRKRWAWTVIESLRPSNIQWDDVKEDDPETWLNVEPELRKNLAIYEFAAVMRLIDEANALDGDKLEENAKTFFQIQAQRTSQPSQDTEAANS